MAAYAACPSDRWNSCKVRSKVPLSSVLKKWDRHLATRLNQEESWLMAEPARPLYDRDFKPFDLPIILSRDKKGKTITKGGCGSVIPGGSYHRRLGNDGVGIRLMVG